MAARGGLGSGMGELRGGNEVDAKVLGERADQRRDFVFQQAGHKPLELLRPDLVQKAERERQGNPVAISARIIMIGEPGGDAGDGKGVGEALAGNVFRLVAEQVSAT